MLCFANAPAVPKCRYLVSLSDGTTIFEDHTPGIPTTWNRLMKYVRAKRTVGEDLQISRVRVQCSERLTNVPTGDGYFIFHREDFGAFSRVLKAIGVFNKSTGVMKIHYFDLEGKLVDTEDRDVPIDHPGLLLN